MRGQSLTGNPFPSVGEKKSGAHPAGVRSSKKKVLRILNIARTVPFFMFIIYFFSMYYYNNISALGAVRSGRR